MLYLFPSLRLPLLSPVRSAPVVATRASARRQAHPHTDICRGIPKTNNNNKASKPTINNNQP